MGMFGAALTFGLVLAGCSNPTNDTPRTETLIFKGGSNAKATVMTLSRTVAASALAAVVGEGRWNYTITQNAVVISEGNVDVTSYTLIFTSYTDGIQTFTATNSGTTITFSGAIPKDTGGTVTIPALTPPNPFVGTWKGTMVDRGNQVVTTLVFTETTWADIAEGGGPNGTYTYTNDVANLIGPNGLTVVATIANGQLSVVANNGMYGTFTKQ
jgi:hypothetical protein